MNIHSVVNHIRHGTFRARTKEKIHEVISSWIRRYRRFFPIRDNRIVFDNFAGRGYADHPRYIAEEIHRRGLKWDIVWLVDNINEPMPDWIRKVRYRSWRSVYDLTTARYWVDNIRNAHLVPKKNGQVYLQTWHGAMPFKKVEKEAENFLSPGYIKAAKYDGSIIDAIISPNHMQSQQFREYFWLNENTEILEVGSPRSDCLFNEKYIKETNKKIRGKLHIGLEDYVVLYAPTFRDDGNTEAYNMEFESVQRAFSEKTGRVCRIIVRLHPNVYSKDLFSFDEWLLDGNMIQDSTEIVICSDAVITDFSSIMYEAVLLKKICFRYALDYEDYISKRPLLPIEQEMPFLVSRSTKELVEDIMGTDYEEYQKVIKVFMNNMGLYENGNAAKKVVDWLEQRQFGK